MPSKARSFVEGGEVVSRSIHKVLRDAAVDSGKPLQEVEDEAGLPSGWLSRSPSGDKLSCVLVMKACLYLGISVDKLAILLTDPSATIVLPVKVRAPSEAWVAAKGIALAIKEKGEQRSSTGGGGVTEKDEK